MNIPLTQGKVAVIDDADWPLLKKFQWSASKARLSWYAVAWNGTRSIAMHRVLLAALKGQEVDHRDGNGLNNRRSNIRIATPSQNRWNIRRLTKNTSGFRGVYFDKSRRGNNKWRAKITINNRHKYLGWFKTREEAAIAYQATASKVFGDFLGATEASRLLGGESNG